jgi:hypothetical protein
MTDKSAIDGDYSNFQLVQSRKVCRITVEFPIERAGEVIRLLGFPAPHSTTRCAVALLTDIVPREGKAAGDAPTREDGERIGTTGSATSANVVTNSPAAPKPQRAPRKWGEMPLPEQVGVRCQDEKFWRYLHVNSADDATIHIRDRCLVISRKEILPGTAAGDTWLAIERDYQAWQKAPAMGVEI